jgi:arylsulfatase A-like enzyme/tetratricopeptide (TPR) repeat protein
MSRRIAVSCLGAVAVVAALLEAQTPKFNVLLITLDTVRADRLGSYGYRQAATPTLDRLAREGVRFADATTQAPLTGPAHAALLTGVYPGRLGIRDNGAAPLPRGTATLASVLQKSGYQTAAFVAAFILGKPYGFDQGFDQFDARFDRFDARNKLVAERTADQVVSPALEWLGRTRRERPFFAWVHFYDAHAPYTPPPSNARLPKQPYDGEIAYVDSAVGKLVSKLEALGVLDRTLVVAIADHGESLGEHGEEDHGVFLYDSTLHIPWIMRLPGRDRAGTVVSEQVRAIDMMPTVLDALGVGAVPRLDGESVLGVVRGRPRANPPLSYAETWFPKLHFGWSELRSARVGEWKFVDAPRPELFDLRSDRPENVNVVQRQPGVAGRLHADLSAVADGLGAAGQARPAPPDRETIERLRSLGYVGFVAPGGSATGGPDPKDMVPKLRQFRRLMEDAVRALERGEVATAAATLRQAAAINERAYDVHLTLGDVYLQQRLFDNALGEYEAAGLLNPASAAPLVSTALALMEQGRLDQAGKKLDQAAAVEPLSPEVAAIRGRLAERQARTADALLHYQSAVDVNPSYAQARAWLANTAMRLKQFDVAGAQFAALLALGYEPARSHYGLGRVAEGRGDRATAAKEYALALQLDSKLGAAREALDRLAKQR